MSRSMPPNSSSDGGTGALDPAAAPGQDQEPGVGLKALVGGLAENFGADRDTLRRVASLFAEVR